MKRKYTPRNKQNLKIAQKAMREMLTIKTARVIAGYFEITTQSVYQWLTKGAPLDRVYALEFLSEKKIKKERFFPELKDIIK